MTRLLILIIFCLGASNCYSQQIKDSDKYYKHNISFHINPAFDELNDIYFPVDNRKLFAYAIRYCYNVHPNIKIGPELSGSKREHFETIRTLKFSIVKIGGFGRFSINRLKHVRPFLETSAYFYHCNSLINSEEASFGAIRGYLAPGISFCLFKNRIGIDIMYKYFDEFVNLRKKMISYRISYNFNL